MVEPIDGHLVAIGVRLRSVGGLCVAIGMYTAFRDFVSWAYVPKAHCLQSSNASAMLLAAGGLDDGRVPRYPNNVTLTVFKSLDSFTICES